VKMERSKSVVDDEVNEKIKNSRKWKSRQSLNLGAMQKKGYRGSMSGSMSGLGFKTPRKNSRRRTGGLRRRSIQVDGLNKMMTKAGSLTPPEDSVPLDCVNTIQDAGNGGKIKKIRFWINEDESVVKGLQVTYITSQWKEKNSEAFIGDAGGKYTEVSILPNEYIVHVLATENRAKEISSLTIVTNRQKTYEVCDTSNMTNCVSMEPPKGFAIVGFFGVYSDNAIHSLGCYSCPVRSPREIRRGKSKSLSAAARRSSRGLKFRQTRDEDDESVSWMDNRKQHHTLRGRYEADIKETLKRLGCRGERDLESATAIILTKYSEVEVKKLVSGGVGTRKFEQQVMREIWKEITNQSSRRRRRSKQQR